MMFSEYAQESQRLEITSAGKLPDGFSQEEFFDGYSIPRNKELMRVFRDLDLVEQMGSGIARILQNYPKTIYRFTNNFIRITLPYATGCIESQSKNMQATMQATMQAATQAEQVLLFCQTAKSRSEIQEHLGFKNRDHFRKSILNPLIESGQLLLTLPDKPTSPKQQFYTAEIKNKNGAECNE